MHVEDRRESNKQKKEKMDLLLLLLQKDRRFEVTEVSRQVEITR